MSDEDSPNRAIDKAIKKLLKDIDGQPPDVICKALNTAINWEKVKHNIKEVDEPFDPDSM